MYKPVIPASPTAGAQVTFTVTIKNQGSGQAALSSVCYYIDGKQHDSGLVSAIPAGGSTIETFTWNAEMGSHSIKAVADCNKSVSESNETNNEKTVTF